MHLYSRTTRLAVLCMPAVMFVSLALSCASGAGPISPDKGTVRELEEVLATVNDLSKWPAGKPTIDDVLGAADPDLKWEVAALVKNRALSLKVGEPMRGQLVSKLTLMLGDDESPRLTRYVRRWLLNFVGRDFTEDAQEAVLREFRKQASRETIRLMGILNVDDSHYAKIQAWAREPLMDPGAGPFWGTKTWQAILVMARRGDEESMARAIEKVEAEEDIVQKRTTLLRDLEYTRRPEAIDHIVKALNSDERLPPLDRGHKGTPCAMYAAESLERLLRGFPEKPRGAFTAEYLKKCRDWVSKQERWQLR